MSRIELHVGHSRVEVYLRIEAENGSFARVRATIDTGAQVSFLPLSIAEQVFSRVDLLPVVHIQQAGIASHDFQAREGRVRFTFEDSHGTVSAPMDAYCWFADADEPLVGFEGVLDRATLFVDMRDTRSGWMEFDD